MKAGRLKIAPGGRWALSALGVMAVLMAGVPPARAQAGASASARETVPRPQIVVTTTTIGSAVAEMTGNWADLLVLTPASAPPGQFALGPQETVALQRASLVLRHDYEIFLDASLRTAGIGPKKLMLVVSEGGPDVPGNYLSLLAQVSEILSLYFPDQAASIRRSYATASGRIRRLAMVELARAQAAVGEKALMVASAQTDFVAWAGGQAALTFGPGEDLSSDHLKEIMATAVEEHVVGVVGDRQWDERLTGTLTAALGVPAVSPGSYPAAAAPRSYDELLRGNVDLLVSLAGRK